MGEDKERYKTFEEMYLRVNKLVYVFIYDQTCDYNFAEEVASTIWVKIAESPEMYLEKDIGELHNYIRIMVKEDLIVKLEDYVKGTDLNASRYYPFDTNDVEEVEYMHIDGGYNYVYGLNVYDVICEDLVKNELSHRPMHLLYEHKSLMCKRILFLIENGFLIAETKLQRKCENLRNDFLLLRNLFLKYKISNELIKKHRLEICDRLMRLKEEDRAFTIELINEIRSERK